VRHEQTHAQDRHWECDVSGCRKKFKLKEYLGKIHLYLSLCPSFPVSLSPDLSLSLSADIHKKTWHGKHDLSANNDLTLRALSESTGGNSDTADQLRHRLVRMSLRQREIVFAQQQREADLLSKLRTCSNYLQRSLHLLSSDTNERRLFKCHVTKFLTESIALGSEDTESSSAESHDDISALDSALNSGGGSGSLLNQADSFISEYLAQQSLPTYPQPVMVNDPLDLPPREASIPVDVSSFQSRKRSHAEVDSDQPSAPLPLLLLSSSSSSAAAAVHLNDMLFDDRTFSPTPSSSTSTLSSSFPSHAHSLYSKFSYGLPPSMTIPQSCASVSGPPACSPTVSGHDVFDLMFSLTSEVNLPSTLTAIPAIPPPHPPPQPSCHSVHNPPSPSFPASLTGPALLTSNLLTPLTATTARSSYSSSSSSSSSPSRDPVGASAPERQSNNISDVMAWIKSNPLKTTKRFN
jgi:hypothetical protein